MLGLRLPRCSAILALALCLVAGSAMAADGQRFTVIEENDIIGDTDAQYTQGLRIGVTLPADRQDSPQARLFDAIAAVFPVFAAGPARREVEVAIGQTIHTPDAIFLRLPGQQPVPFYKDDRPETGHLYLALGLHQETEGFMLDSLQMTLGVLGPASGAEWLQNRIHCLMGSRCGLPWDRQIENEPAATLSWSRRARYGLADLGGGIGVDVVPFVGVAGGNVLVAGDAGFLLRVGSGLAADYGPARAEIGRGATTYANPTVGPAFRWQVFAGVDGRVSLYDVSLDGSLFRDSFSVDKELFVVDLMAGATLGWGAGSRLSAAVTWRSREFETQSQDHHLFGTLALGVPF